MKKIIFTVALIIVLLIPSALNVSACDWGMPIHLTYTTEDESRTLYFRFFYDMDHYSMWLEENIWNFSDEDLETWESRRGWGFFTAFIVCNIESQIITFIPNLDQFLGMMSNDIYASHDLSYFMIHSRNPGQNCNTRINFFAHGDFIRAYSRRDFISNHASGWHGGGHLCDWRWDFYWYIADQCNDTLTISLKTDEGRVIFFDMATGDVVDEDIWIPPLDSCIPHCCCDEYYHDYHGCCGDCVNFPIPLLILAFIFSILYAHTVPITLVIAVLVFLIIHIIRKIKSKRNSQNSPLQNSSK